MPDPTLQEYPIDKYTATTCLKTQFASEREFCDYLELNIHQFCIEDLGYEVGSYWREFSVTGQLASSIGSKRVDFFIKTKCGLNIIIECKVTSKENSEMPRAIGQILSYIEELRLRRFPVSYAVLVGTKISLIASQIIERYDLPITLIAMDKEKRVSFGKVKSINNEKTVKHGE
jgi:hypothetical protein